MLTKNKINNIIGGSNTEIFTCKQYVLYKKKNILETIVLNDIKEEYQYINNPHDKIFRKILDNKNEAINVINRIVKDGYYVSAEEIEKYNSSYISDTLRNSEADIVYKLKNKEVFFLIEHQTKIDYSMPYRILKYEVEIIESVLIDKNYKNKKYKYPAVISIVLYTGNKKWDAKLDLRKIQLKWNKYEGQEFSRYNILDINELEEKELLEEKSLISKMMLIEKSDTKKELERNLNKIIERKEVFAPEQRHLLITIIQLVLQNQLGKCNAIEIINKLRKDDDENMLAVLEMLDRENARIRNEGRQEGKIEYIKNMLKEELSIELICKITGLKKEEIEKIQKNT